jgi:hypothetical protein
MAKKIQVVGSTVARIIDTTRSTVKRLDPDEVAKALGAEPAPAKVPGPLGPVTLYAVRTELFRRLQSHGGRPGLEGNNMRPKIPLNDQDWHKLEGLAAQIAASTGLSPSPGQVGSVLLSLALRSVTAEESEGGASTATAALVNELTARGTP